MIWGSISDKYGRKVGTTVHCLGPRGLSVQAGLGPAGFRGKLAAIAAGLCVIFNPLQRLWWLVCASLMLQISSDMRQAKSLSRARGATRLGSS